MRRKLGLLLLASAALASCHAEEAQETLLIAGSTTMDQYLKPVVEAFHKKHKDASIIAEPGGSRAGVIALKRRAIDVATIEREVTSHEDDVHLRDYLVARDGIAIIVHPQNPVEDLTLQQLTQICIGEVRAWKELARPGAPAADLDRLGAIVLVDRTKDSKTRRSLVDVVLAGDDEMRGSKEVASAPEMLEAIKSDPRAIGFASFHTVAHDRGVKPVAIEGVEMKRETMLSGRYGLTRSFYLALYLNPPELADQFVGFALGPEGQQAFEHDGLLAVH